MITKKGTVVKKSGDKTFKIRVEDYQTHPKYKKRFLKTTHFLAHYEGDKINIGDAVIIKQNRPLSKLKSWTIAENNK